MHSISPNDFPTAELAYDFGNPVVTIDIDGYNIMVEYEDATLYQTLLNTSPSLNDTDCVLCECAHKVITAKSTVETYQNLLNFTDKQAQTLREFLNAALNQFPALIKAIAV